MSGRPEDQNTENRNTEEGSFIREYTKSRPLNKKTLLLGVAFALLLGVVFGGAAALTYRIGTGSLPGFISADSVSADVSGDTQAQEEEEEEEEPQTDTEIVVEAELEISDYQQFKYELYAIGRTAGKSIVTVGATSQGTDLFQYDYETTEQNMGLVISVEEDRLLILTQYEPLADAAGISVIFSDDTSQTASLMGYDANLGLAVISVDADALSASTLGTVSEAVLKTGGIVNQGQIVVAIGAPLGSIYSILDGTVTSVTNQISLDDSVYTIFTTSMTATESGSGVLVNTDGEVIGMMLMEYNSEADRNTLTAVSMKELYPVIEKLMEGGEMAYMGVTISTITSAMAEEYDMPAGVYIREVADDSPAFNAGLQPGDIIVQMGIAEISDTDDFMDYLLLRSPDQNVTVTVMRSAGDSYAQVQCTVQLGQK